jgi:simple sugar transport system permease protein
MSKLLAFSLVVSGIHLTVPLLLASMGGLLSERSGVINIALEGQMLVGAFMGVAVTWWTGNLAAGFFAAVAMGAAMGILHAWFSVTLRADQIVAATAWNLGAAGLTAALIGRIWGEPGASAQVQTLSIIKVPGLASLPGVGQLFAGLTPLDWFALALVPGIWAFLYRTPSGLRLRSCGEDPHSAASVGIDVGRTRYAAVMVSAMLAALGGVYLSLVQAGGFERNMTQGRGFLALAALIFGKWRPFPVLGACMLFGLADALQFRAQATGVHLPHDLLLALPYVVGLVALATFVGRASAPAAVGKPYAKD